MQWLYRAFETVNEFFRSNLDSSAACKRVISIAPAAFPQYCICAYSTPNTQQHSTSVRENGHSNVHVLCYVLLHCEIKYRLPTGDVDQDAATQHMKPVSCHMHHHSSSAGASTVPTSFRPWPLLRPQPRRPRPCRTATFIVADAHNQPLVVVGSVNADMMLQVDRFPKPGETLSAQSMTTSAGGKVW